MITPARSQMRRSTYQQKAIYDYGHHPFPSLEEEMPPIPSVGRGSGYLTMVTLTPSLSQKRTECVRTRSLPPLLFPEEDGVVYGHDHHHQTPLSEGKQGIWKWSQPFPIPEKEGEGKSTKLPRSSRARWRLFTTTPSLSQKEEGVIYGHDHHHQDKSSPKPRHDQEQDKDKPKTSTTQGPDTTKGKTRTSPAPSPAQG